MSKTSAGLLMYKRDNGLEFFLVHPGGPFWKNKDENAWGIPKGEAEIHEKENLLETAKREIEEETGIVPPKEERRYIFLGEVKQSSGKKVVAWAFPAGENSWSGFFKKQQFIEIEFPPKSGRKIKIPEVDRAGFFNENEAKAKMIKAQFEFIVRLKEKLK